MSDYEDQENGMPEIMKGILVGMANSDKRHEKFELEVDTTLQRLRVAIYNEVDGINGVREKAAMDALVAWKEIVEQVEKILETVHPRMRAAMSHALLHFIVCKVAMMDESDAACMCPSCKEDREG